MDSAKANTHNLITVIKPAKNLLDLNLGELWQYRELIMLLAHRDFVALYKQTILGSLWYFLQPLLQSLMFVFVFNKVAQLPTSGVPPLLFYMAGTVCWRYFAECVTKTANTFTSNQNLFDKVYFPRIAVPLAQLLTNLTGLIMGLIMFAAFYLYYFLQGASIHVDWRIIVLPLLILQMAALGLGIGCIISGLTTKYRDLQVMLGFLMQLWMYASCVVYPLQKVPAQFRPVFDLNPIVFVIESFRFAVLGQGTVTWGQVVISSIISIFILVLGVLCFNRVAQTSVDTA